jgi:hypothetical protein
MAMRGNLSSQGAPLSCDIALATEQTRSAGCIQGSFQGQPMDWLDQMKQL